MKHAIAALAATGIIAAAPVARSATLLVWDGFTEGDVHLSSMPGPNVAFSRITSPVVDTRKVWASANPYWSVTMEGGTLTYLRVLDPGALPGRPSLDLTYRDAADGTFSIFGADSYFVLDISRVVGEFTLRVTAEKGWVPDRDIPVDGPGLLMVPVSRIGSEPLTDLDYLKFAFTPRSRDFALSIDGISLVVVPEPSVPALAAAGALLLLFRRRRRR